MFRSAFVSVLVLNLAARGQTITFEDLALPPAGYYNGSTLPNGSPAPGGATQFTSGGASFNNNYDSTIGWAGWAYSRINNVSTAGFGNQYAAYNLPSGSGDSSLTYGVAFQDFFTPVTPTIQLPANTKPVSMRVTNTTYAALSMLNGDPFAKKFGGTSGNDPDFFVMTIRGYDALNNVVGTTNFYLADYRFSDNAQDYVISQWTSVDLSTLPATTTRLTFSLASSDNGSFGMNTPAYFALDNLVVSAVPEPGSLVLAVVGAAGLAMRRHSWKRPTIASQAKPLGGI